MIPLFLISVLLPGGIVAEEPPPVAKAALRSVNFLQDPNQQPPAPPKRAPARRPRMEGSVTGYIDNAIVGSQIRMRSDEGFNFANPDRAEFFYGKCGCYRNPVNNPNYDPNAPGPGGPPKNLIVNRLNFQEIQLNLEYAVNSRFSVFTEVPGRSIEPDTLRSTAGLGDVRAGFKFALQASPDRYLTFQMRNYFPTGHADLGLGTSHYSVEPALLYNQRISERVTLAGQFGDWHPIGGSAGLNVDPAGKPLNGGFAGDILNYGFGASYDAYSSSQFRFTPVLEAVGWSILGGDVTRTDSNSTSGANIFNLKLGARISTGGQSSIYIGYGRALSHVHWYHDIVRLEYRWAF